MSVRWLSAALLGAVFAVGCVSVGEDDEQEDVDSSGNGARAAGGSSASGSSGRGGRASGGTNAGSPGRGGGDSGGANTAGSSGSGAGTSGSSGGDSSGGSSSEGCGEPPELAGITEAHNEVRRSIDAEPPLPPLEWSCEVAAVAQAYADELASRGCPLEHSKNKYGENLYWASGGNPTAESAVAAWASEGQCYSYATFPEGCRGGCQSCGHYTQLIWRNSSKLGCGKASCGREQVWVCNYDPPGNFLGQRPY